MFKKLWKDESGQGMVEYALILALIVIVVIVAMRPIGNAISALFGKVSGELTSALESTNTL